ncbi:MAG: HigA family addiction module antitoxin [Pseudomonadales bacterium]|jgi:addiction module HigA family antidote|tara:strand:+ start:267 stop:527 length:261 start_codon:yes stop_codon:yes gene_type:complete
MINNPLPMHPGQVLAQVYMSQLNLNQTALANLCGCSPRKVNEIVNGKRSISPAFAITLETVLGTSAEMWVRMQAEHDLGKARQKAA